MSIFCVLPDDLIITIVVYWVQQRNDLLSFDTSLCNRDVRLNYLRCPKRICHPTSVNHKHLMDLAQWQESRNYKFTSIEILFTNFAPISMNSIDFSSLESLTIILRTVDTINNQYTGEDKMEFDLVSVISLLPRLKCLKLRGYGEAFPLIQAKTTIGCKYHQLEEFHFEYCQFERVQLYTFLEWMVIACSSLKTLVILDVFSLHLQFLLDHMLPFLPSLTTLRYIYYTAQLPPIN